MKKMNSQKNDVNIYVMDIKYTDSYNPEHKSNRKREFRYIIDGDGKEKLVVYEEKDEVKTDEEK